MTPTPSMNAAAATERASAFRSAREAVADQRARALRELEVATRAIESKHAAELAELAEAERAERDRRAAVILEAFHAEAAPELRSFIADPARPFAAKVWLAFRAADSELREQVGESLWHGVIVCALARVLGESDRRVALALSDVDAFKHVAGGCTGDAFAHAHNAAEALGALEAIESAITRRAASTNQTDPRRFEALCAAATDRDAHLAGEHFDRVQRAEHAARAAAAKPTVPELEIVAESPGVFAALRDRAREALAALTDP